MSEAGSRLLEAMGNYIKADDERFAEIKARLAGGPTTPPPQPPAEPPVQQPPPLAAPKPGQFFPVYYNGPFPGFDVLTGPPHSYPKGATIGTKGPRGGAAWGVVNPASSTTDMPEGFTPLNGKVGE